MTSRNLLRSAPRCVAAWLCFLSMVDAAGAAHTEGILTFQIANVRSDNGHVHVEICPEPRFLKDDCPYSADAPAHMGTTTVTIRGVPPGRYAAQVFHDENNNRRVDRALFGVPKEGVGFSNDARISLGPPKFTDAAFDANGQSENLTLHMRYFLGPSGPKQAR